jgi:peptidoglycan/LPS O-acetylase OafA/YrhL
MGKLVAIEGLRGWLAWTVVFSHLAMTAGIYAKGLGLPAVHADCALGDCTYLLHRFMRLFPLFAVT